MRRATPARGIAAVLLVAAAAVSCRNEPTRETAATPPAATAAQPRSDAAISTAVQAKFYTEDLTRGRTIDVSAENGVVTLRGTVPTEASRQRAVELARGIEGVTSVADQLEVSDTTAAATPSAEPPTATGTAGPAADRREPAWITTKIQAQYFVDPDIKPWVIDVNTGSGGVVTLEGKVDSAEDKMKAVTIARETEGVTRVEDRLQVEGQARPADAGTAAPTAVNPTQPDAWVTAKIQAKYFVDDEVKARTIDVTTQNGVVTLQGTVASEAERRQAIALARNTEGVRNVTDELRVDAAIGRDNSAPTAVSPGRPPVGESDPTETRGSDVVTIDQPDPWITMKIQSKYFLDDDVKGRHIDVDTRNGVVTLKGTVDNAQQKQEAEQIARETEGVKRVVNQLAVGAERGK